MKKKHSIFLFYTLSKVDIIYIIDTQKYYHNSKKNYTSKKVGKMYYLFVLVSFLAIITLTIRVFYIGRQKSINKDIPVPATNVLRCCF